jgi:integrase
VNVLGKYTKNRKPVENRPIPGELADHLRTYLDGRKADARIWPGTWKAAKIVKGDLSAARAAWINEAKDDLAEMKLREQSQFLVYVNAKGEFGDMHAWRHTFVSMLVASGVNYKTAVELARHSDARITLERYAHVEQEAAVEAVNRMPQFLAATGTDGPRLDQTSDEICAGGDEE